MKACLCSKFVESGWTRNKQFRYSLKWLLDKHHHVSNNQMSYKKTTNKIIIEKTSYWNHKGLQCKTCLVQDIGQYWIWKIA
jgi:hypothetical protein